jgi:anti-sigma factor RsiW
MSRLHQPIVRILNGMMGRHEYAGPVGLRLRSWLMRHVPGQLTCEEFEQFVHDYQEGSLSPRERRVFDFHMELCPMCRVHFATYLQTIELEKRICSADEENLTAALPDDLVHAILAARNAR